MNDERRILEEYANPQTPLLAKHSDNPKSSVNNFAAQVLGGTPKYVSVQGTLDSGRTIWRQVDTLFTLIFFSYPNLEPLSTWKPPRP
jgi:hypothetical protein